MANAMDYLDWRGDLTFDQSPFNEVDNLLLAELSYMDFTGIVPDIGKGRGVPLCKAVETYFAQRTGEDLNMGVLLPRGILDMAKKMAETRRFRDMKLSCCRSLLDADQEAQFAAITCKVGDGTIYLSFRGTDDTIIGWKEDFNMTFLSTVPSQELAARYTREVAVKFRGLRLRLGGHSKGGNLAVYAAVNCGGVQKRIAAVYSNDGPGFKESLLENPSYLAIRDKIHTIVPQSSVVGFLLEHDNDFTVVKSSFQGLYQHDGLSWEVLGAGFVPAEQLSADGQISQKRIRAFFNRLSDEQRRQFAEALFEVLSSTNAQTLSELDADWGKTLSGMVRTYRTLSRESRQMLAEALRIMLQNGTESIREGIGEKGVSLRRWIETILPTPPEKS